MHKIELFTSGTAGYFQYRIPALVVSVRGTVLAFCEARRYNGRDDDEIHILLRRSLDGGRTWEDRLNIVTDGDRTCGNPCPVVDHETGTVILPFCKDSQEVFVTRSDDDGVTWSEPEEITSDAKDPDWTYLGTGPGHGIQLSSGRLLIPCWSDASPGPRAHVSPSHRFPPPSFWGKVQSSFALFSDDGGSTWQRGEEMTTNASDECEAVELNDGAVYMNMRSRQVSETCGRIHSAGCGHVLRRASARSDDGGRTWSDVEYDPTLPDPSPTGCQGSVVRLDEGRVLLSHPSDPDARSRLTMRLSLDECRTWPVTRVLHEGSAAYSDLAIADGCILCFYEAYSCTRMVLAHFTPEWLESA